MAMTATVSFRTTPELKERVDNLARLTKRSAGFYYNVLLEDYLVDLEDIYLGQMVAEEIRAGKQKTYSLESVIEELADEN